MKQQEQREEVAVPGPREQADDAASGVVVFTVEACRFCREAKAALAEAGVSFREVGVGVARPGAAEARAALAQATGIRTVPVVFAAGQLLGGCDDTKRAIASGKLTELLSSSPQPLPEALAALLLRPQALSASATPAAAAEAGVPPPALGGLPQEEVDRVTKVYRRMAADEGGVKREDRRHVTGPLSLIFAPVDARVFSGAAGVQWLRDNVPGIGSCEDGVALGRRVEALGLLHHSQCQEPFSDSPSAFFRLLQDEAPLSSALNAQRPWLRPARSAALVASELRTSTLALYEEALSLDGKSVDYERLKGSSSFQGYVEIAQELQKVEVLALSPAEQKAFWLNIYNSLNIHGLVAKGTPANLLQRLASYNEVSYRIAGLDFSLNDVEHGVLRANRSPPPGNKPRFGPNDPRRYYSLPPLDPRIHFALNCGAKSCPPIRLFSAEELESELCTAAAAFLSEDVEVKPDGAVHCSKLLQWYGSDFGANDKERLEWVSSFLGPKPREVAEKLLQDPSLQGKIKLHFRPYDWNANNLSD